MDWSSVQTTLLAASLAVNIWQYQKLVTAPIERQPVLTLNLPDGWWSDPVRFETERRAIFSQTWICVSHRARFKKAGDYIVYEIAGFRFFMILGNDSVVRSFHNVCRHRAFPVARKDSGSASVLGCRYHGWSYDTTGKLVKAPYFDNLPGFDKSQNSLFEINTKQDSNGFLYINVSNQEGVSLTTPPKAEICGKVGKTSIDSELLQTLEYQGKFNWKVILNQQSALSSTSVSSSGVSRTFSTKGPTPIGELHFFPLTSVHTMAGRAFWYQLTYSPKAAELTNVRCDIYANSRRGKSQLEDASKDALEKDIQAKIAGLEKEHKALVVAGRATFGNNEQAKIHEMVESHLHKENDKGSEIKPAAVSPTYQNAELSRADKICEAVDCATSMYSKKLTW